MSGIAGILKRDGGPVPENWPSILEQTLLMSSSRTYRFEDSIPIQNGSLHILLLGSGSGSRTGSGTKDGVREICDGEDWDECAYAHWHEETLQLELGRRGTGRKPLYWLDLDEVGDGLLFSSNPMPLLKIAEELDLPTELQQGVAEYLQLGYAVEGGALLSPICSMPIEEKFQEICTGARAVEAGIASTPAEDLKTLVTILGKPFADYTLLSKLWQYRSAKDKGIAVLDGTLNPTDSVSPFLERVVQPSGTALLHKAHRAAAKRIELGVLAEYVGVQLHVSEDMEPIPPVSFPMSSWLKNPVSSLGELAEKTFECPEAFCGLSIEQDACRALLNAHQRGDEEHGEQIFALLTLLLWRLQVLA